jgi:hypothetical protein
LRPSNLPERVRAIVLSDGFGALDLEDIEVEGDAMSTYERLEVIACNLGMTVAVDLATFLELLPDLVRGGNRAWAFGRGLARGSDDRRCIWRKLAQGLEQVPSQQQDLQVLGGFLAEVWDLDRELRKAS